MKKISVSLVIIAFVIMITAAVSVFADNVVDITRQGRRVSPDGFLLEWNLRESREWRGWGSTEWRWDAINTADGVAGYFMADAAQQCSVWTFTVNTEKSLLSITVPKQAKTDIFAFDKGSFESEGTYAIEWVVPWSFFGDLSKDTGINKYTMTLTGENNCGGALPDMILSVHTGEKKAPSDNIMLYGMMAVAAVITYIISAIRRANLKTRA